MIPKKPKSRLTTPRPDRAGGVDALELLRAMTGQPSATAPAVEFRSRGRLFSGMAGLGDIDEAELIEAIVGGR